MTGPGAMRDYHRRFAVHADMIEDESRRGATPQPEHLRGRLVRAPPKAHRRPASAEMQKAFNNIRDMMQFTSDNLARSADQYDEARARTPPQTLSS